jgi:adenosylcobinamide-GDP ribazoletransferase
MTSGDERRAALEERPSANAPRALLAQLLSAVRFLTVLRPPGPATDAVGESALFFPVVGLGLGAVLVVADAALAPLVSAGMRAVVLVGLLTMLTGGRQLAALAQVTGSRGAAGSFGGRGALAATATAVLEVLAIVRLTGSVRGLGLLFAPMLARWSMVAFASGSRTPGGAADDVALVRSIKFREFAGASVFALGVTLAYAEARGLTAVLAIAMLVIACRVAAHRVAGGVTAPAVVALGTVNETLALALFGLGAR